MADRLRVAVVGGGITGLAAACEILARARQAGRAVQVTVLERAATLGGNLRTESESGFLFDTGPDSWVATKPHATRLARDLGLAPSIIETNPATRRFFVARQGRLHPVPEGLVLGVPTRLTPLARSGLFSWRGKIRMACEPLVPVRRFEGDDDESIGAFVRRRLGREAADRLASPLLGGISSGDADELSVRAAFPQLVAMEREHGSLVLAMRAAARGRAGREPPPSGFLSLAGGVAQLVDALAARLDAGGSVPRRGAEVRVLARQGAGWMLVVADGERIEADRVLVCAPPPAAAALLRPLDDVVARDLSSVECGSTTVVFLGYRRAAVAHPLDGVGFVVPREMGRPLLAGTWVSSKWRGRAPEGHVLLRVFLGGPSGVEVGSLDDPAVTALARRELGALMAIDAEPVVTRVYRFAGASPMMRVGHLALVGRVRARLASVAPGVHVAGGGYEGLGIPDCIRQAQEAAAAVLPLAAGG